VTDAATRYSAIIAGMKAAAIAAIAIRQRVERANWEAWLAKRSAHVRERILRFYPAGAPAPGTLIRGHYRGHPDPISLLCGVMSRGAVIRRYGREVWNLILERDRADRARGHLGPVRRRGRRHYAGRIDVLAARVDVHGPKPRDARDLITSLEPPPA
jgi:hypothetical protein